MHMTRTANIFGTLRRRSSAMCPRSGAAAGRRMPKPSHLQPSGVGDQLRGKQLGRSKGCQLGCEAVAPAGCAAAALELFLCSPKSTPADSPMYAANSPAVAPSPLLPSAAACRYRRRPTLALRPPGQTPCSLSLPPSGCLHVLYDPMHASKYLSTTPAAVKVYGPAASRSDRRRPTLAPHQPGSTPAGALPSPSGYHHTLRQHMQALSNPSTSPPPSSPFGRAASRRHCRRPTRLLHPPGHVPYAHHSTHSPCHHTVWRTDHAA